MTNREEVPSLCGSFVHKLSDKTPRNYEGQYFLLYHCSKKQKYTKHICGVKTKAGINGVAEILQRGSIT